VWPAAINASRDQRLVGEFGSPPRGAVEEEVR
jgi:hypothetical protein